MPRSTGQFYGHRRCRVIPGRPGSEAPLAKPDCRVDAGPGVPITLRLEGCLCIGAVQPGGGEERHVLAVLLEVIDSKNSEFATIALSLSSSLLIWAPSFS